MPSIAGARRGNLLYLKPYNLQINIEKNYSRPELLGKKLSEVEEMLGIPAFAAALKDTGVKVPIVVKAIRDGKSTKKNEKTGDQIFDVVSGFRRALAVSYAYREWNEVLEVPAIFGGEGDEGRLVDNLLENDQRADISPTGRAAVYAQIIEQVGGKDWTEAEKVSYVAKKTGRVPDFVRDHFKLVEASDEVKEALTSGKLSWSVMRRVLRLPEGEQTAAIEQLRGLSAEEARRAVANKKKNGVMAPVATEVVLVESGEQAHVLREEEREPVALGDLIMNPTVRPIGPFDDNVQLPPIEGGKTTRTQRRTERPAQRSVPQIFKDVEAWLGEEIARLAKKEDRSTLQDGELRALRRVLKEMEAKHPTKSGAEA